jgi:lipopolysaccharide/colanic/teichoic acid biosynthesis glycosyltransferase
VCGALGGLLFFAPVMAAVAVAIAVDDGWPLRDGRVTRIGRLLRATGLDELPQFVNILRGELSAVGPRPVTAGDAERYGWLHEQAAVRWSVNPGLTGLGQLAGASAEESLALDRLYVRERSLALDCRLIAMSFVVNLVGKSRARRLLFSGTRR